MNMDEEESVAWDVECFGLFEWLRSWSGGCTSGVGAASLFDVAVESSA